MGRVVFKFKNRASPKSLTVRGHIIQRTILIFIAFCVCVSNTFAQNVTHTGGPGVYVAGVIVNTSVVWKNGTPQYLTDGLYNQSATYVFIAGNDVYVAGTVAGTAVLWKNGVSKSIADDKIGEVTTTYLSQHYKNYQCSSSVNVTSFFVSGNDVYVAGFDDVYIYECDGMGCDGYVSVSRLWKNGVEQTLENPLHTAAQSVYVSGNDVYVSGGSYAGGYVGEDNYLWKNGVKQKLPDMWEEGGKNLVFVSGNDIYVASTSWYSEGVILLKNGVKQYAIKDLNANSIFVSGNDVYLAGAEYPNEDTSRASLWKNNIKQSLTNTNVNSVLHSVFVSGNDVYVAGYSGGEALLWKNGVSQNLYGGARGSSAFSVFVVSEQSALLVKDATNLINTMPAKEYRELNELLTEIWFPSLTKMAEEESLIDFAAYVSMYGGSAWGKSGSKEAVEAILNRYFGVEKVYHERSSLYRSWEGWDVDYPIDGVGHETYDWANVTKLQDVGNGTFVADVDLYVSSSNWDDSWLEPVSKWKLKNGTKIINISSWNEFDWGSSDIFRYEPSCKVTIKPFVYKGEKTWQIVGINGVDVPKVLFAQPGEAVSTTPVIAEIETEMDEPAVLYIYRKRKLLDILPKQYDILVNNVVVGSSTNNWKTTVPIRTSGTKTITATIDDRKSEVQITVAPGGEYYLRSDIDSKIVDTGQTKTSTDKNGKTTTSKITEVQHTPILQLVGKNVGEPEFKAIVVK